MHHIVYLSTAVGEMDEASLKALLVHSRRRNEAWGISGLLLFSAGQILQVLEGAKPVVQALFGTISRDCRHTHVQKLADGSIRRRMFSGWSMGFAAASPEDFAQLAGYHDPSRTDFLAERPPRMDQTFFELMKEFATSRQEPL